MLSEIPHVPGFMFPMVHIIIEDKEKKWVPGGGSVGKMLDIQN